MADSGVPAGPSIRAQAKKSKQQQNNGGDKASTSKSVVKAVLANPLTVPWPSIPRHLQTTVLANLPVFVPTEVAAYHVDRARCHQADKRKKRSSAKEVAVAEAGAGPDQVPDGGAGVAGDIASEAGPSTGALKKRAAEPTSTGSTAKRPKSSFTHPLNLQTPSVRPAVPAVLPHLVFGINEVIKSLENQTSALRLRVMMIGDALAEQQKGGRKAVPDDRGERVLLPTAPPREEDGAFSEEEEEEEVEMEETAPPAPVVPLASSQPSSLLASSDPPSAPVEWIIIPLLSISPATLVSPIPAYCATYNTLVYQYTHISKIARTRLPAPRANELIGAPVEEVRVIPLGKVEEDLAALVGLRRVASLGIRSSHPQIETLRKILPKSILHPPRHSLTLPFPTSALTVTTAPIRSDGAAHADPSDTAKSSIAHPGPPKKRDAATALLPHIHYAPLHVKGITTTIPADGNAKKQKRMEEVRAKRRAAKERKKLDKSAAA